MALRLPLIILALALALTLTLVVESSSPSSSFDDTAAHWGGLTRLGGGDHGDGGVTALDEDDMMMDSEINRRMMVQWRRFISYGALKKNRVPCSRRGRSYYNCMRRGKANPYRRGCSIITHCARQLD